MKRLLLSGAIAALGAATLGYAPASAQEPLLGEIRVMPYSFCPRGWMESGGQVLPISSYEALFSLYGAQFGGDGRTTFALPDLRGRAPMGIGAGPGLTPRTQAERLGEERVTLLDSQMPTHNHIVRGSSGGGNVSAITGAGFGDFTGTLDAYRTSGTQDQATRPDAIVSTGASQSHENRQPSLALRYCVAMVGLYPSRN